jgi:hypothetical protein
MRAFPAAPIPGYTRQRLARHRREAVYYEEAQSISPASVQAEEKYIRQLPVVLDLIFQLRQFLDNSLALLAFLLVGDVGYRAVQIIDCAGLYPL